MNISSAFHALLTQLNRSPFVKGLQRIALPAPVLIGLAVLAFHDSGSAQIANQPSPNVITPLTAEVDQNGLNVTNGLIRIGVPELAVPAAPRLRLDMVQNAMPYLVGKLGGTPVESSVSVHIDGATSMSFSCTNDDFCSDRKANGSRLDGAIALGGPYSVTVAPSGAVYNFDQLSYFSGATAPQQVIYYASSAAYPDGEVITYTYNTANFASGQGATQFRVTQMASNTGYHISFTYQGTDVNFPAWRTVAQATLYRSSEPSSPLAQLTYGAGGTVTDLARRTYTCAGCDFRVGGQIELSSATVTLPGESSAAQTISAISYNTAVSPLVTSVVRDGVAWSYSYTNFQLRSSANGYGFDSVLSTGPDGFSQRYYIAQGTGARANQVSSVVDSLNRTTSYLYDINMRLTRVTLPQGNYVQIGYDSRGNITSKITTPKAGSGLTTLTETAAIDAGRCASVQVLCYRIANYTNPLGRTTNFLYNDAGQLVEQTDPADANGIARKTYVTYVGAISRATVVRVCGTGAACGSASEIRTEYDYWNNTFLPSVERRIDAAQGLTLTTTYNYDTAGRLLSVDGPLAGSNDAVYYRYDILGRRTWEIGPLGATGVRTAKRITYRNSDDKVTLTEIGTVPDPTSTTLTVIEREDVTYDTRRYPVRTARSAGGVTYAVLDRAFTNRGQLDCETVRMNPAIFGSLPASACTAGAAGSGANDFGPDRITKRVYDAAGQLTKTQVAVGTTVAADDETNTYTTNGKLATVTDGELNRTTFEYDGHDRLSKTRYPLPTQAANASSTTDFEQLTYDAVGNVTRRRTRDGLNIDFSYDALNRVRTRTENGSLMRLYEYNALGLMTMATWPGGYNTEYKFYNAFGWLTQHSQSWDHQLYQYDAAGRRTRLTWGDGFYVSYDHDAAGRMIVIRENGAASGVGVLATYSYDGLGRRTSITRGNGTVTNYGYDAIGRLSSLTHNLAGTTHDATTGFAYSPASQLTSVTRDNDLYAWNGQYNVNRPYTVNGLNQLTAAGGTALGYDGRGNLTSSGSSIYSYDAMNQLVGTNFGVPYVHSSSLDQLHGYDVTSGSNMRFSFDGPNLTSEFVWVPNGTSYRLRRTVFGPGVDDPLVWYEGTGTSDRRWLHADERGSVVAVSDAGGTAIGINRYDEFGIPAATNIGRFQYTGQAWIPELGLYYYKARYYSATLGRFMQTDPIGYKDGINWYDYVDGDPVNHSDPTGLCTGSNIADKDGGCKTGGFVSGSGSSLGGSPSIRDIANATPGKGTSAANSSNGQGSNSTPGIGNSRGEETSRMGAGQSNDLGHKVVYDLPKGILVWIHIKHFAAGFFGDKSKFSESFYKNLPTRIGMTVSSVQGVHQPGGRTAYTHDWGSVVGTLPNGAPTTLMTVVGGHTAKSPYGTIVTAYPGPLVWP